MDKFTSYKIFQEQELIIKYYSGKIFLKDIIDLTLKTIKDKKYNPQFNVIQDFREADVSLDKTEIPDLTNLIRENPILNGKRNSVCLTSTPNQVALSMLFESQIEDLQLNFYVVSTIDGAAECICLSHNDKHIINSYLEELKMPADS